MAAAPSDADRKRLHDVVVGLLITQAQQQVVNSIGERDLLLAGTLKLGQVLDETYDPPAGQPGNLLQLTMRAEFTAAYVKSDDIDELAEATLDAAKPAGFAPVPNTMTVKVAGAPTVDSSGSAHFQLKLTRRLAQEIDLQRANVLARGRSPQQAQQLLMADLHLGQAPKTALSPPWWPWMPLVPFRITVSLTP